MPRTKVLNKVNFSAFRKEIRSAMKGYPSETVAEFFKAFNAAVDNFQSVYWQAEAKAKLVEQENAIKQAQNALNRAQKRYTKKYGN